MLQKLYYYLTVPEVELTPKEIAESIVDDMLDAIFPAEAAAREFLDRLLEKLDRELLPKGKSKSYSLAYRFRQNKCDIYSGIKCNMKLQMCCL